MFIGEKLVRIAERRVLDIRDALDEVHPNDSRKRAMLEKDLAEAQSSLRFRRGSK